MKWPHGDILDKEWLERVTVLESLVSRGIRICDESIYINTGQSLQHTLKGEHGQMLKGQQSQHRPGKGRVVTALGSYPCSTEVFPVRALARSSNRAKEVTEGPQHCGHDRLSSSSEPLTEQHLALRASLSLHSTE